MKKERKEERGCNSGWERIRLCLSPRCADLCQCRATVQLQGGHVASYAMHRWEPSLVRGGSGTTLTRQTRPALPAGSAVLFSNEKVGNGVGAPLELIIFQIPYQVAAMGGAREGEVSGYTSSMCCLVPGCFPPPYSQSCQWRPEGLSAQLHIARLLSRWEDYLALVQKAR